MDNVEVLGSLAHTYRQCMYIFSLTAIPCKILDAFYFLKRIQFTLPQIIEGVSAKLC